MKCENNKIKKHIKEKSKLSKEEWREYTRTVWQIANTKHSDHPAVFPEQIPYRLIKLFSFVGETVLDPFAGIGTTGKVALNLDRKTICVDQNQNYLKLFKKNVSNGALKNALIKVGDSRKMDFINDNSTHLIVTSPPYWNKANYGSNKCNIGNMPKYNDFLESTRSVFKECFRVLHCGRKICIVTANVNQYTDHGLLTFPLAADFARLLQDTGFVMVSEIIWSKDGTGGKWGSHGKQRPIFGSYPYPPNFLFKNVHEHILVFSKPPIKLIKNKNAIPYKNLF